MIIEKKPGVLDPQAQAINQALSSLGFDDLQEVKMGKQITVSIDTDDEERARYRAAKMCEALLANTVIETYTIEINEPS
ncbi:MAG: phosphoribosylformylglycinamidine synthase subunit PurS [Alphaproteobacteria bacterium]|nr:phosphoribosylformylglycinamidine synthase subunit PurS [Alphaproteobacteria bacterium]